jgi:LCP family protein required for cell wall assembly
MPYQSHAAPTDRPYGKRQKRAQQHTEPQTVATAATAPIPVPAFRPRRSRTAEEPLSDGLNRIQRSQAQQKRTPAHRRLQRLRRPRSRRFYAIASIPLVLFLTVGAFLAPALYQGVRAYRDVFVEQPPTQPEDTIAFVNAEGTPVLEEAPAEAAEIPEWDGEDRVTLLLLGVDKRPGDFSRSDTMILVNIDPKTKTASMLSIPRDLQVFIPGHGVDKINAAYAIGDKNQDEIEGGGAGLTMRTITANFGITINYFASVDFQGFVKIVDTLGGVTLDVKYPIKDDAYPASGNNYMRIYFPAGWQHMNGERALQYARTRHSDSDGHRSARQQEVLLALRQQAVSLNLLSNADDILREFSDSFRTSLSLNQVLQLARLGSEISAENITQYTLDSALYPDDSTGTYYLMPDWDRISEILSEFSGEQITPPGSVLAHPDTTMPIRILNGTEYPGLAGRVASELQTSGYENIFIADDGAAALQDYTTIAVSSDDLATSMHVAAVIGVPVDAIDMTAPPPTATPEPTATSAPVRGSPEATPEAKPTAKPKKQKDTRTPEEGGIVIVLGYDAPDPAYFSAEPVEEGG